MGRNRFLALIILVLIALDASDASLLTKLRKLAGEAPEAHSTTKGQISPEPSPAKGRKQSDSKPTGDAKVDNVKPSDTPVANSSSNGKPKSSGNKGSSSSRPSVEKQTSNGTVENDKQTHSLAAADSGGNCNHNSLNTCRDQKELIACIKSFPIGSGDLVLLVQNEGDNILKVNVSVQPSPKKAMKDVKVPSRQAKPITVPITVGETSKIVLNAGNGGCILDVGIPKSGVNYFLRLPSYSHLLTPINGAYLIIFTALMFGGTWACCKIWKKSQHRGVPYQELEMGLSEPGAAANVEAAEGWDWDDDWDEDMARKSPRRHHEGNISGNGLTSRSSKKDGWENDWDN